MAYNNLNVPATLIHRVNGKKYTLEGKLLAINESANTCTMKFGSKINRNIPLDEVYLNEGVLDTIKDAGKALWNRLKGLVQSVAGFILPVDENDELRAEFMNLPINVATMELPESITFAASNRTREILDEYGLEPANNITPSDVFDEAEAKEAEEANKFFGRVMKKYSTDDSMTVNEAFKYVCNTYYKDAITHKSLNESVVTLKNLNQQIYGNTLTTEPLVDLISDNLFNQLLSVELGSKTLPLLIWGAPGIGKTAIIKQAAKSLETFSYHLDTVVMACGGLKYDDFDLPTIDRNLGDEQIAGTIPKTWLPVYDKNELILAGTLEQVDNLYNKGSYKVRKNAKLQNAISKKDVGDTDVEYDGGILFFDEFARVGDERVMQTLMTLLGDRVFQNLELASRWIMVAAANRLTDDAKSEFDTNFWGMWDNAKNDRFTHVTFMPTREEWLQWAREINKDGYQNVDELICKFIEFAGDGVWYDALDFGSREITSKSAKAQQAKALIDTLKITTTPLFQIEDIKRLGKFASDRSADISNISRSFWNPRDWDQKINTGIILALRNIFFRYPEKFEDCFTRSERTRNNVDGTTTTYNPKNIDMNKLSKNLETLNNADWLRWAKGKVSTIRNGGNLLNNPKNRFNFFMKWIKTLMDNSFGIGTLPGQKWDNFDKFHESITAAQVESIWKNGTLTGVKKQISEDEVFYKETFSYLSTQYCKWKGNPEDVKEAISIVIKNFKNYIKSENIAKDVDFLVDPNTKKEVTEKDIEDFINFFTIKMVDGDKSTENNKIYVTLDLFSEAKYDKDDLKSVKKLIILWKYSSVAKYLANVAKYFAKVNVQTACNDIISSLHSNITNQWNDALNKAKSKTVHDRCDYRKLFSENLSIVINPKILFDSICDQAEAHDITIINNL